MRYYLVHQKSEKHIEHAPGGTISPHILDLSKYLKKQFAHIQERELCG